MTEQVFLDGNVSFSEHMDPYYSSDILSLLYNAAAPVNQYTDHAVERNTKGIAYFMEHLARTMTTNVRTTSFGSGPSFNGIAWKSCRSFMFDGLG
jgi:hypothetical protein